ncbi:MAG TPA: glutaredoxin 3 [Legionellaceae bacterium]|nr:glutaredoxin 3 [Legionellaceae bacterium]
MLNITMYSTATCPYCERARQLLHAKKVSFTEIRVDDHPEKRAEMQMKSQRHTVPQIFINEYHVGGCDDLYALDAEGRLDELLQQG